ncbi:MAG: hypothetical protein WCG80_05550 [Spirochaetales bacterium]
MRIAPEVYSEIRRSMVLHDIASYKGEGFREGEAIGEARGITTRKLHALPIRDLPIRRGRSEGQAPAGLTAPILPNIL